MLSGFQMCPFVFSYMSFRIFSNKPERIGFLRYSAEWVLWPHTFYDSSLRACVSRASSGKDRNWREYSNPPLFFSLSMRKSERDWVRRVVWVSGGGSRGRRRHRSLLITWSLFYYRPSTISGCYSSSRDSYMSAIHDIVHFVERLALAKFTKRNRFILVVPILS